MRSLTPKDAIAYLEINDLSETLNSLTENPVFQENSKSKVDFSAFKDVQMSAAITGFETSEKLISDENSVLDFKPKFVVIADTHAWNWQAVSIAENQIGKFVQENYGENVKLENSKKKGADFFVWTNNEGKKLFAAVAQSVIYIGNDETLLDNCLDVQRGEAENSLKNENLSRAREKTNSENLLAFGYLSSEGIKEFAGIASVSAALSATENEEGRSLIAQVLPKLLQNTTEEIVWSARKTDEGIEDSFFVNLNEETASVFKETLAAGRKNLPDSAEFLPSDNFGTTVYSLQNPLLAWRSLILAAAKNTDAVSGKYISYFSDQLLSPYGISNPQVFLSSVDSDIYTALFDAEGENSVIIVSVKDAEKIKKSIAEIDFKSEPEKFGNAKIWKSEEQAVSAAFIENKLILGNSENLLQCLRSNQNGQNLAKNQIYLKFALQKSTAFTFGKESGSAEKIISLLGDIRNKNKPILTNFTTATCFTGDGIERKTVSAFGFLGTILEKLKSEN